MFQFVLYQMSVADNIQDNNNMSSTFYINILYACKIY